MRYKRQIKMLGLCKKPDCFSRFQEVDKSKYGAPEGMVAPKNHPQAQKCCQCMTVTGGTQETNFCQFCGDNYCESCLGYNLFFDLQELEDLLK